MKARSLAPILIGAAVGLALGLYYAWVLNPVEYVQTTPNSLRAEYREAYLVLIADAYEATGDLARAEARLDLFELDDPAESLTALAQERLAQGGADDEARALARLASELQLQNMASDPTATGSVQSSSGAGSPSAARPTATARNTATATIQPTRGAPFALGERQQVCDPELGEPRLQVFVEDAAGQPVPGVQVIVLWDQGQDSFYTGLKPELGLGYADFTLEPEREYTVQLAQGDLPVTSVQSEPCQLESGDTYPGSVRLTFVQPRN